MNDGRPSNVSDSLLPALGSLSIADSNLRRVSADTAGFPDGSAGWREFATHLRSLASETTAAAAHSSDKKAIVVITDETGHRFRMDVAAVDQLTGKLEHHVRVAYLIGYEPTPVTPPTPDDLERRLPRE